jgi:hypothetical protein
VCKRVLILNPSISQQSLWYYHKLEHDWTHEKRSAQGKTPLQVRSLLVSKSELTHRTHPDLMLFILCQSVLIRLDDIPEVLQSHVQSVNNGAIIAKFQLYDYQSVDIIQKKSTLNIS